ncbi:bifunctional 3,4-dihydroxy-2-butanone-4-phosphate synthase/GTP cyclohydrolase II [Rhodopirellula baltica]|uniref:GTP cyclohydrolase-2 n=2 Tax=Rhodopirellula baltica TaxID=265606 RepID=F2ALA2_RHOBT|nr:bifunctional 3,4-dihydroxy-2-butanone-4-phosphate synthase/GTP cyclohydrolase II [Rhodopirellula baltica]EGF29578.1 bifunctional 3,4-dihydroxy-2-butanone 4-phosphate synthase/GTP cyclohydrolase II protein [Rhodopirellula baltica WH47]ELP30973.1 bifunctional 3,4-dihydroxy-2-butanone 4-phosphate synthase/GTP cyclohydrolase II protein [Rhodopirellula baltica SWK14]
MSSSIELNTIPEAVEAIARGEVIIVIDAEDRENEGDFICAGEKATPELINFILGGRGQLCVSVLPEVCKRLELTPVVPQNNAPLQTAFMTPIDIATAKTGITAAERSETIRRLTDSEATQEDFVRPGHVYPLLAKEGGVLRRAGHTEAAIDLSRMAGLAPVGVLCEVLNETGDRASRDDLARLAKQHDLKIISIEHLIAHRRVSEKLVSRAATSKLPTRYGDFEVIVYEVNYEAQEPIALVYGDLTAPGTPPLVRMHSSCFTGDLIQSLRCDCGDQLHMALDMISREGRGALIYLPQEGRGIGLAQKIRAYALQDKGMDTVEANHALGFKADMRDYGVGLQILKDLGLSEVRLLTNNPKKTKAFNLRGFDLKVVDQVPIVPPTNEHNVRYLETKREKMGHQLPPLS